MNGRRFVTIGGVLTLITALAACGDLAPAEGLSLTGPGRTEASAASDPPGIPATGTLTKSDAARVGLRADGRCASPSSVSLLKPAAMPEQALVSLGGFTTDYSGLLNWNLRMAGAASFPDEEDLRVPHPDGLFAVCWYNGVFKPQSSVTGLEAASADSLLVVYDDSGLRNVVVSRIGPIAIIAPDVPAGPVSTSSPLSSLTQMPGVRITEGQSLFDLRTAEGKPSPVPGER